MIDEFTLPTRVDASLWQENGYWISPALFSQEEIARAVEAMDRVLEGEYETGHEPWSRSWNPGDNPRALRKIDNSHWANRAIRDLVLSEAIGAVAARLMQTEEVRLWHDQMLFKPGQGPEAETGENVGWHQDHGYWANTCPDLLTAWIALVDVDESNGCMHFVPGSHRWGMIDGDFFDQDLVRTRERIAEETGEEFRTVPIVMRAGQVIFHHCLTIHGSGPNRTDSPRRSFAVHLQPAHASHIAGTSGDSHQCSIMLRHLGGKEGSLYRGGPWPTLFPERSEPIPCPSHREMSSLGD
jgi:ectoine hydroxylase-related dioxygenase (phytanoyl-CoA dioxygenase family)